MALPHVVTTWQPVKAHVAPVAEEIVTKFPPIYFLWGKSSGSSGEHPKGLALDFSILNLGKGVKAPGPARTSLGQQIADYVWANRARLNVWYVIWNRRIISARKGSYAYGRWVTYHGKSSHTDHVHVSFNATGTYHAPSGGSGGTGTPPTTRVSLKAVRAAAMADKRRPQGGTTSGSADDVRAVETALKAEGLLPAKYAGDGSFGTYTLSAYSRWQRKLGYTGADADGIPGQASLVALGRKHGFTVVA